MYAHSKYFIRHEDKLYLLIRKFQEESVIDINELKEFLHCDLVLRKDNYLHFCQLIEEAIIEEDEIANEISNPNNSVTINNNETTDEDLIVQD